MAEEKQFIDKAGLEAFWASVENALTRMYPSVPEGKQIAQVYQKNGRVHVAVEDFGGSTDSAKKAARGSLGVGIYHGELSTTRIDELVVDGEFNHGDTVTVANNGDVDNGESRLSVYAGDILVRCVEPQRSYWKFLVYTTRVDNQEEPGDGVKVATEVTKTPGDNAIQVKSKKVGLVYVDDAGTAGTHCMRFG
jgi:hypothetical protein